MQAPLLTNLSRLYAVQVSYNPGSIAANTVAADGAAVAVPGVRPGDIIIAVKPTQTAGLAPVAARVSAEGQVTVAFANATAGAIDAGAEVWQFLVATPDPNLINSIPA